MKKKLLSILTLLLCLTTGAWASTVNDLATISSNYTFTASDYSSGLTGGTLYDSNRILSLGSGNSYNNGLQIKTNRQIAFKVSGSCTATFVFTTKSGRSLQIGSSSAGTEYGNSESSPLECNITAAGVVYISASSDLYLTSFTLEFASGPAKAYTVTAASNNTDYGTASAAATSLDANETTTITAYPKTGYEFTSWSVEGTGSVLSSTTTNPTTLTMGTANTTVTASFTAINYTITHGDATGGTYTISVAGGEAVSTNTTANYGQTITLAGTPTDPAHTTIAWNVKDASNNDVVVTNDQFTMPASAVTISPVFSEPRVLNTLFSMTSITGITKDTGASAYGTVNATFSEGASADVFNNKGDADGLFYNNSVINLNSSGSSYIHIVLPTKLVAGDVISAEGSDGKNPAGAISWKLGKTTSTSAKDCPYTLTENDNLIGATELYITKNNGAHISAITISGEGQLSDLTITSSATPTVAIGATSNIEYTSSSEGAITYTSSDTDVATVSSTGVITGVDGGVATITIEQAADATYRAGVKTITVTVPAVALLKIKTLGSSDVKTSGTASFTADVNLSSNKKMDKGRYFGFSFTGDDAFQTGDVVEINITAAGQGGTFKFYDSKGDDPNLLYDTEVAPDEAKTYKFVMPASMNGVKTVYLRRGADNSGINEGFNPVFDYVAVYRPDAVVTLNASGFATYSAASDFELLGADAYAMALDLSAGTLAGTKITGKIPAGAGILFKGTAGDPIAIMNTTGATALEGNDLHGTTQADGTLESFDSNKTYYVLSGDTFKKYTGTAFAANKAFFQADGEGARSFTMTFDNGETTGIADVRGKMSNESGEFFDLQGRKVAQPTKGLYIVNGHKVVIK
jgi:uncharacterized repeat protein (TIGR02543 family)